MYNNLFNVLEYVNCAVAKNPITSHPGNIEHSQTIISLLTNSKSFVFFLYFLFLVLIFHKIIFTRTLSLAKSVSREMRVIRKTRTF